MRHYILYDGRANYDVDEASALESLGEFSSLKKARKAIDSMWKNVDWVLVSYEVKGNQLTDEQVHYAED